MSLIANRDCCSTSSAGKIFHSLFKETRIKIRQGQDVDIMESAFVASSH